MGPDRTDPLRVKRTLRRWTEEELDLLKTQWPIGGYRICKALFPNRSRASICGAAGKLGITVEGYHYAKQYPPDAGIDELIRRAYADGRGSPKRLAQLTRRPRSWVSRRATELGVSRPRGFQHGTVWAEAEDQIIHYAIARNIGIAQIQRKLRAIGASRGISAIRRRVGQLGGYYERDWSTGEVAALLDRKSVV